MLFLFSNTSSTKKTHVNSFDLEWPEGEVVGSKEQMGHRGWPNEDLEIVCMPLFMRLQWMIFDYFSFPHNVDVTLLAWLNQVTEIKISMIHFVGTDGLMKSWKCHNDSLKTAATAQPGMFFFGAGVAWTDLVTWPGTSSGLNYQEMCGKNVKTSVLHSTVCPPFAKKSYEKKHKRKV